MSVKQLFEFNLIDIGALIVALFALSYSCSANRVAKESVIEAKNANKISEDTLYESSKRPFTPFFTVSDPLWKVEGTSNLKHLNFVATIVISNEGAKSGCLDDITAVLDTPAKNRVQLRAYYFVDNEGLTQLLTQKKPLHFANRGMITPIALTGRERVTVTLRFRTINLISNELKQGEYELRFMAHECSQSKWRELWKASFNFSPSHIKSLLCGDPIIFDSNQRLTFLP